MKNIGQKVSSLTTGLLLWTGHLASGLSVDVPRNTNRTRKDQDRFDRVRQRGLEFGKNTSIPVAWLKDALVIGSDRIGRPSFEQAQAIWAENPPELPDDPQTWTLAQQMAWTALVIPWGQHIANNHDLWHQINGPGGTYGPGSGELFLSFHHALAIDFNTFSAGARWPSDWDMSNTIPPGIFDPNVARITNNTNAPSPNWISLGGNGTENGNLQFGAMVEVDDRVAGSLDDFTTLDDLGRAIGELNPIGPEFAVESFHTMPHDSVNGIFATYFSPLDPVFGLVHGRLEGIAQTWVNQTVHGNIWANANPNHPFLNDTLSYLDPSLWNGPAAPPSFEPPQQTRPTP